MPVFDFNQEKKDAVKAEKTYELIAVLKLEGY